MNQIGVDFSNQDFVEDQLPDICAIAGTPTRGRARLTAIQRSEYAHWIRLAGLAGDSVFPPDDTSGLFDQTIVGWIPVSSEARVSARLGWITSAGMAVGGIILFFGASDREGLIFLRMLALVMVLFGLVLAWRLLVHWPRATVESGGEIVRLSSIHCKFADAARQLYA